MGGWPAWLLLGLATWAVVSIAVSLVVARAIAGANRHEPERPESSAPAVVHEQGSTAAAPRVSRERRRILIVDDDASLRLLLRTTLSADEFDVDDEGTVDRASESARFRRPSLVILDVGLPGADGLEFARELKRNPAYGTPTIVLLTGGETTEAQAAEAGAEAILRKPFSPLELLGVIDRLTGAEAYLRVERAAPVDDQMLAYARDLARTLEVERSQRRFVQYAYRQTITALAEALEAMDLGMGVHAVRVQQYGLKLAEAVDPSLLDDPSLEYGFLLHDVGKMRMPDRILNKRGPLTPDERRTLQRHPLIGVEMLSEIALLQGEGLKVVRSHHERWDGGGYPDGLARSEIPLGARVFALSDSLDAMTSDRPYRPALGWDQAVDEILGQMGGQFDPQVVSAFAAREPELRELFETQRAASG